MTNESSLLWKKDTRSHSRKYLLFQKTPFSSNKQKNQNWNWRSTVYCKRGSGGNSSGVSRILLKNIPCPKKEWKNEAHNRTFHSKQICFNTKKKFREKSRECHNHKPQPFPDTKRKRKQTKPNKPKQAQIEQTYKKHQA